MRCCSRASTPTPWSPARRAASRSRRRRARSTRPSWPTRLAGRPPARHPVEDRGHRGVLDAAPDLLAVGAFCIGTNQIDLPAASERGRRRLQRAVLQHPQRRRAGDRGDHRADPPADREERRHARRRLGQVRRRRARDPRPPARHRRLRQHRRPALGARRVARHVGVVLRHRRQARAGQRPALRHRSTSCSARSDVVTLHVDGRPGNADMFGEEQFARMRPGQPVPQPLPRLPRRPRRAARSTSSPATSPAPRSTSSRSSRRPGATSSSPSCAACPTSSSRRTSAARPRRRSRTSAATSRASCATTSPTAATTMSVNLPHLQLPDAPGHAPHRAPAPQRPRRARDDQRRCSPRTRSTSRASCSAPAASSAT